MSEANKVTAHHVNLHLAQHKYNWSDMYSIYTVFQKRTNFEMV